uniref:Metalloendopeptidase n=1 Tax=Fundulus heteroclitus TaxID=8078 RepID=A0A3Q2QHU0_FUNHE
FLHSLLVCNFGRLDFTCATFCCSFIYTPSAQLERGGLGPPPQCERGGLGPPPQRERGGGLGPPPQCERAAAWDHHHNVSGAAWDHHNVSGAAAWDHHNVSANISAETLEDVEENLIEEGDIIAREDRNAVNVVWSNAIVPYEINPDVAHRVAEIQEAFRMISAPTCIRFVAHTNELNYIKIRDGNGCASSVGVSGGGQSLYFAQSCSVGNLVHELIHALGLYHEHTRDDRDQYITINWSSVIPDMKGNFKVQPGNKLNQPYDYESIMHYGPAYFSVDGSPTIVTNTPRDIGQRTHLSSLDIKKLKALYRC